MLYTYSVEEHRKACASNTTPAIIAYYFVITYFSVKSPDLITISSVQLTKFFCVTISNILMHSVKITHFHTQDSFSKFREIS